MGWATGRRRGRWRALMGWATGRRRGRWRARGSGADGLAWADGVAVGARVRAPLAAGRRRGRWRARVSGADGLARADGVAVGARLRAPLVVFAAGVDFCSSGHHVDLWVGCMPSFSGLARTRAPEPVVRATGAPVPACGTLDGGAVVWVLAALGRGRRRNNCSCLRFCLI